MVSVGTGADDQKPGPLGFPPSRSRQGFVPGLGSAALDMVAWARHGPTLRFFGPCQDRVITCMYVKVLGCSGRSHVMIWEWWDDLRVAKPEPNPQTSWTRRPQRREWLMMVCPGPAETDEALRWAPKRWMGILWNRFLPQFRMLCTDMGHIMKASGSDREDQGCEIWRLLADHDSIAKSWGFR